jgi:hypothetical protein
MSWYPDRENCGADLTWKHPLDNSEITGNPEDIAGQKSACEFIFTR